MKIVKGLKAGGWTFGGVHRIEIALLRMSLRLAPGYLSIFVCNTGYTGTPKSP